VIPTEFGRPFLEWLRAATERTWQALDERTLADYERAGVGGCSWRRGTHWSGGLDDREIEAVETRWGVHFAPDHRLFLQVLHATEPLRRGAAFVDRERMRTVERPGFYHWQRDVDAIREAFDWLVEGLVFDVEHNVLWPASWGARPDDAAARRARVSQLVKAAPRLVPLIGHRYVLAEGPTVVLSVYQSDIIVYGRDLRVFLLNDLADVVGVATDPSSTEVDVRDVPLWGQLVTLNHGLAPSGGRAARGRARAPRRLRRR